MKKHDRYMSSSSCYSEHMAYNLKSVTIRVDNSREGMEKIKELRFDIQSGKIPLLFDNTGKFRNGISPVSCYPNYKTDENGFYDLSWNELTRTF